MQPRDNWGPLLAEDREGTVYEAIHPEEEDNLSLWDYDYRGRLHQPHTIVLAHTPAGSVMNISHLPKSLLIKAGELHISPAILRRESAHRHQQMSQSHSHLPSLSQSLRNISNSIPHLHKTSGSFPRARSSTMDINKRSQFTKPEKPSKDK
jgi:hypothetical protein